MERIKQQNKNKDGEDENPERDRRDSRGEIFLDEFELNLRRLRDRDRKDPLNGSD